MSALSKSDLARPALSNQYQVYISGIPDSIINYINDSYTIENTWVNQNIGLLCSEATLPTSSFATSEVKDNFQGINQQFAHTRLYVDSDFTFYVDNNYNMIKFFEGWMDYISGQSNNSEEQFLTSNYFYRKFNYPFSDNQNGSSQSGYKVNTLSITKFEKDYETCQNYLKYSFINVFPKSMTAIPVSYGSAELVKATVSFAYDRYIMDVVTPPEKSDSTSSIA